MKSNEKKVMMTRVLDRLSGDRGSAMLIAMMVMVILTLLGISFMILSDTENKIAINDRDFQQVLYVATGAAKIVESWFNSPDPAYNDLLPVESDLTLDLRKGDSDFDGYYGSADADGIDGDTTNPEIDATVYATDKYKGGNTTGKYKLFDRPFRGSRYMTFWGNRDNPDILIQDDTGDTAEFIDEINEIINPNPDSSKEKKSLGVIKVREIRIYGPPMDTDQKLRYGVATIEVKAAKEIELGGGEIRYVSHRLVREVIQEIPYPNPGGPIISQGSLSEDSLRSGLWGPVMSGADMTVNDADLFEMQSVPRDADGDYYAFNPDAAEYCANAGNQNLLSKLLGIAGGAGVHDLSDPWKTLEAKGNLLGGPNGDRQPWPHADDCTGLDQDKSHFFQKGRITYPRPEYAIWKSIVASSNHQKIRYFVQLKFL